MRRVSILTMLVLAFVTATAWACPPSSSVITCTGTVTDTAMIQTAFNALPSTGGVITIGGTTRCGIGAAGLIFSGKTDVVFQGQGGLTGLNILAPGPTFLAFGSTSVQVSNCTRCQIRDLYINGGALTTNLIGLKDSADAVIAGNSLTNSGLNATIVAGNNTRARYEGNTIWGLLGTSRGIWIGNGSSSEFEFDPQILNNRIVITTATAIATYSSGAEVRGNILDGTGGTAGSGIALGADSGFNTQGTHISGNIFRGWGFHGIQSDAISDTDVAHDISVVGNLIEKSNGCGIYGARVANWTVQGNIIRDNNANSSGNETGIRFERAKTISIVGNDISDTRVGAARTQYQGIAIIAQVSALEIRDVTIVGNTVKNHLNSGIHVTNAAPGTMDGITIVGNVAVENDVRGIGVLDAVDGDIAYVIVANNIALRNGTQGIRVDPTTAINTGNQTDN